MSILLNRKFYFWFGLAGLLPTTFFYSSNLFTGKLGWEDLRTWMVLIDIVFSILITLIISAVVISSVTWLEKALPWNKGIVKRLVAEVVLTFTGALVSMYLITLLLYHYLGVCSDEEFDGYLFKQLATAAIMNFLLVSVSEGAYFFIEWKKSLLETERLKQEQLQSQFDGLKNQLNPHFLFNSLNALSALVHEDPDKAETFIEEFADVYRYVLDNKGKALVPLKEELDFLQSYAYLHLIRFDKNLRVNVKVDGSRLNDEVPPLSLHELFENAVKHNKISSAHPLTIDVFVEDDFLCVRNNLQVRKEDVKSTGTGLKNLTARYGLLSDRPPEFHQNNQTYSARIPLIQHQLQA